MIGRNEPCGCGSGKKFKHCCLSYRDELKKEGLTFDMTDEVYGADLPGIGSLTFNVSKAWRLAAGEPLEWWTVDDLKGAMAEFAQVEEEYIEQADLSKPVLVVTFWPPGIKSDKPYGLLIDGNHRVTKADRHGLSHLTAKMLGPNETALIMVKGALTFMEPEEAAAKIAAGRGMEIRGQDEFMRAQAEQKGKG